MNQSNKHETWKEEEKGEGEEKGQEEKTEPELLESVEVRMLKELEYKIQELPNLPEIISSIIDQPKGEAAQEVQNLEAKSLNWDEETIKLMLISAVKYRKGNIVDFLINCRVKTNAIDDHGKSAADYAWQNKDYKMLLLLLNADYFFPCGFNLGELSEDCESKEIKDFVEKRGKLHESIKNDKIEDVQNLTLDQNSILYLNVANESAAHTALMHEKFAVYAYLKSIGVEFGKKGEEKVLDRFPVKKRVALQEAMVKYFPAPPDAHIYYLISKSRSQKPVENLTGKLKSYYEHLNKIPEVSFILKVLQYADYLDIIFDFDEEEVSKVDPVVSSKDCCRGETVYKIGRIYIAACSKKRKRNEILGTITHEFTHMAMEILYENDCNAYGKSDETTKRFFQEFKDRILKEKRFLEKSGDPFKILLDAIDKYPPFDHDSEFIARVPHILVQFERDKEGKDWLKEQILELKNFYEQTIVPKCEQFIREAAILKSKSIIKSMNESVGETTKLRKCNVFFNNSSKCQSEYQRVSVIKVKSILLGTLKVLQRLFGKNYANFYSRFLVLKFENFVNRLFEISQAFFMEGCNCLIIETFHKPTEDELEKVCNQISDVLDYKPHKKCIFVAHQKVTESLGSMLQQFGLIKSCDEIFEDDIRLDHLETNSQEQILRTKVFFQGKPTRLKSLIQVPELYHLIRAETIEDILEGRKVNIGNKILGLSCLDGPYADIFQDMDFESFKQHVTNNSNEIFIVCSKKYDKVKEYFNEIFKKEWINSEFLTNVAYDFEKTICLGKVVLVNDRFESKDFRNFCKMNSKVKSYFIDVKNLNSDSFILQEFYNPRFYEERKIKKISVKVDEARNFFAECTDDTFIIIDVLDSKKYIFEEYSNVKYFEATEAEAKFKMLSKRGNNVHWFKLESDRLVWIDSYGCIRNLRNTFQKNREIESHVFKNDELSHGDWSENDTETNTDETLLNEKDFTSEICQKQVVLIADNAGNGKSTTLTKLYESKTIADKHWIIRINLKDHLQAVKERTSSHPLTHKKILLFLQKIDPNLKNELNESLLNIMLTTENKISRCLLIAFDGFDEILDENDREYIAEILKFLKNKTHSKIWITSRPQYKNYLEEKLETFAIEFQPFDVPTQKSFIVNYLKDRLNLIVNGELLKEIFDDEENSKISNFQNELLTQTTEIFKENFRKFMGIPLQLNLVLSGSLEYFKTWTEKNEKLDFSYLGKDLLDVYKNFIEKKYLHYFKKCNITESKRQEREKTDSENYNENLAESLICKREALKPKNDDKEIFLLIGLIQSQNDENFEFIHFTFREYYFAKVFAEYIFNKTLTFEKMVFLFEEILAKREFEMIHQFLYMLLKEKNEAMVEEKNGIVDFLIKCGVDVNEIDENGYSAADYAWKNRRYKMLLLLLKADSFFPAGFVLSEVREDDDDAKQVKNFVQNRFELHDAIKNDKIEDVKKFISDENSTFYLNGNNESAPFTAIKYERFTIYAYLKSVGVDFAKKCEKKAMDTFGFKKNVALQEAMIQYFSPVADSHIHYLISKSRSHKPVEDLNRKLMSYYSALNEIPEISIIMKVIQNVDYLDIIFDFDEENISEIYPLERSRNSCLSLTEYKIGRIYISKGERKTERMLGSIAQGLTRMAMQTLYENDCNPYEKMDQDTVAFFQDFKRQIALPSKKSGECFRILFDTIRRYRPNDQDAELTARITHILALHKDGRDWLKKQAPQLFNFYKQKIVPKCQDFIREGVIFKQKSIIKSINEGSGEILKLKKYHIYFNNAHNIFQNDDKQIFVIKVENTLLGTLKVLQRLYGKSHLNFQDQFLVLEFGNFVSKSREVLQAFFGRGKWLIIAISYKPKESELERVCDGLTDVLDLKAEKKVIFIVFRDTIKYLLEMLKAYPLLMLYDEMHDDDLSLDSLDTDSQERILEKKVFFQGKLTLLKKLIQVPELYNVINPYTIQCIFEEKKVSIGNEISGLSSLEKSYAKIAQEINFESFVRHVTYLNGKFIVRSKLKRHDELVKYFNLTFKKKHINTEFLTNITYHFERAIRREKVFLVNHHFKSEDFKTFCKINSTKKCYLIDVKDFQTHSFFLQEFFDPDFYIRRNVKTISIKIDKAKYIIHQCKSETFVVGTLFDSKTFDWDEYSNVMCSDDTEAENNFKLLSEPGNQVHWFKLVYDYLIWIDSYGSTSNLRSVLEKYKANQNSFECNDDQEDNLVETEYSSHNCSELQVEFNKNVFPTKFIQKRIMLIADSAGTGKSTFLAQFYEKEQIANEHWIIPIILKDHLKAIRAVINSKALNADNIIRFLQETDPNLKNELNQNLLKITLTAENKFPKCLLLNFDGFDELLDETDRENILNVLKYLKDETRCKIWITTRPHYKKELENALETFALEFHPFDAEKQGLFIIKYLKNRFHLTLNDESFSKIFDGEISKISVFKDGFLLKAKEIFKKDLRKFIGIPLQLNMLLSNSAEYVKNWAEKEEVSLDFKFLDRNLLEVYKNLIAKIYCTFFKKMNIIEKAHQKIMKDGSENYNKELAESLIYKREVLKPKGGYKETFLLIGLVRSENDENFEFIHSSFGEYYFAQIFAEHILRGSFVFEKMALLFQEIFIKPKFQMTRNFFNELLNEMPPEEKLEEYESLLSEDILKPYTTWDSSLVLLAQEGLENILKFICSIYFIKTSKPRSRFSVEITNILNKTLFHAATIGGKREYWTVLLHLSRRFSIKKWENCYYKYLLGECIYLAVLQSDWILTEAFLKNTEVFLEKNEIPAFLEALNEKYKIFDVLNNKRNDSLELLRFLLNMGNKYFSKEKQKVIFGIQNTKKQLSVLHFAADKKDWQFIDLLLNKCKEIMELEEYHHLITSTDYSGNTILHKTAENGNLKLAKLILKEIENDLNQDDEDFITLKNDGGSTALDLAVQENNIEMVKFLCEEGKKILREKKFLAYTTKTDKINGSFCRLPFNGKNARSLVILYETVEKKLSPEDQFKWLMTSDNSGETLFHQACFFNDSEMMKFILEKLDSEKRKELLMTKSDKGQNCLQLSIQKGEVNFLELLLAEIGKYLPQESQSDLLIMTISHWEQQNLQQTVTKNFEVFKFLLDKLEKILKPEKLLPWLMGNMKNFVQVFQVEIVELILTKIEKLSPLDYLYDQLIGNAILQTLVLNDDLRVAKLIFEKIERNERDLREYFTSTRQDGKTCFHLAAEKAQKDILAYFYEKAKKTLPLEQFRELLLKQDEDENTVLHTAAKNSQEDVGALKLLLEKIDEILSTEQIAKFIMNTNKKSQSALHVASDRNLGLMLILEKAQSILPYEQQRDLLLLRDCNQSNFFERFFMINDYRFLKLLLQMSEKILRPEDQNFLITNQWNRILSNSDLLDKNGDAIKILLQNMEKIFPLETQQDILMSRNKMNQTLLEVILSSESIKRETMNYLMEKFQRTLTSEQICALFTTVDNLGNSLLHTAILSKNFDKIKSFFEKGEDMLKSKFSKPFTLKHNALGSILHAAVSIQDHGVVKYIINKGNRILKPEAQKSFFMMTDGYNRTILHLAAENTLLKPAEENLELESKRQYYLKNWKKSSDLTYLILQETGKLYTQEEQRQFLMLKDYEGRTAFDIAANEGEVEAVKLILQEAEKYFVGEELRKFVCDRDGMSAWRENYMMTNLITAFIEEKTKAENE